MQRKVSIPASADGLRLAAIVEAPEKPKAVVQFVHGMCEHKERYVPFMEYLASMGYACVIHDNRGHGKTLSRSALPLAPSKNFLLLRNL